MEIQDFFDFLNGKKIIIYGAGKIGKRVYQSLLLFGFRTDFFWDNNAELIENFDKISIIKPEVQSIPLEQRNDYVIIITIFAENISYEISSNLSKIGYNDVIYDRNIINSLIYHACKRSVSSNNFIFDLTTCHICPVKDQNGGCDIFDDYVAQKIAKGINNFLTSKEKLIIPKLGILVSNRCNLSCKGCNHLRYIYSKDNIDLTPEELLEDLTKVVEVSDLISKVVIVGGEAFIHPNLYIILKEILELPKIGIIHIITNGTVKPKNPDLFRLISDKRIILEISNYGEELSKRLQDNMKKFMLELDKYNVNYLCMNTLQWFDFGDFSKRFYSKEQHHNIYKTCCFVSNDLFRGRLYKCSRSAFGTLLGEIPNYTEDYVDIRNCPKKHLRNELINFLKNEYPEVCQHCNGTSTKTIKAGIQINAKRN